MLCSLVPFEGAGSFILVAKEDPARKRRHWRASARACCDTVVLVVCETVREVCIVAISYALWTCRTDRVSVVPAPCSNGVGLGVLFESYSFIMMD